MRRDLPSGTVTLLFTDVEGSTTLLRESGAAGYAAALMEHRRILRAAFAAHGGTEVDTQGDAFFVAFPTAAGALAAALQAREELRPGPIRVRIGIHTGSPHVSEEGYVGEDVHKAARIGAAGHGGQILLSRETRAEVSAGVVELGEHRLKDFVEPVPIFQVGGESFPPLNTVSNTNLPRPAGSFVGRLEAIEEIAALLGDGARLVTLTGPGGSGKTRLAIEAASRLVPSFRAGVFWVPLAQLRDPALVQEAIARTLGAKEGLADHIGERDLLLLIDNLEQVIEAAPDLAALVERCPNLRLLVTSRQLLRVGGEREYPVAPLTEREAVELFCTRAQLEPTAVVADLCRTLDNLPLAVELAAVRTSVLSPRQILERLSARLDLLEGGRDAAARHVTLRATIDWSYTLLNPEEQRLFARLSVFSGCTLEAAEEVAGARLNVLQSLVEKSLVRHDDERFWLLETIREYAAERLEESGEGARLREEHAGYFRSLALQQATELGRGEPEEGPVSVLDREVDNLRAAVDLGLAHGDGELVREITASLPVLWLMRGLYSEGRDWLERALELDETEDDMRRRLLSALGNVAYAQGDHPAAVAASDEAAILAAGLSGTIDRMSLLREQATSAARRGDAAAAEAAHAERLELALEADNGVGVSSCRLSLVGIANDQGRFHRAEKLLAENLPFVRSRGQTRCEAYTLASMAQTAFNQGRESEAGNDALLASTRALQIRDLPLAAWTLDLAAATAAARGDVVLAAALLGATESAREAMGTVPDEEESEIRARALARLGVESSRALAEGRSLDLDAALELAGDRSSSLLS